MKKHPFDRPFRTSVAALALGASGIIGYQLLRQPAEFTAANPPASHLVTGNSVVKNPSNLTKGESHPSPLTTPLSKDIPASHIAPSLFKEFNDWAGNYAKASPAEQQKMLSRGDAIVKERREKMAALIETDPKIALAESDALSPLVRDALPESLKQQLEQPVNARGDLTVVAYTGGSHPYKRFTTFGDEEYTVYPANKDESIYGESNRSLLGIKLTANRITTYSDGKQYPRVDRVMALRADRLRVLNAEQSLVALKTLGKKDKTACSVSGKSVAKSPTPVVIEIGGGSRGMCQPEHASAWVKSAEGIKAGGLPPGQLAVGGPGEGAGAGTFRVVPEGHSTGNKSFLCVRFRCPDQSPNLYDQLETTVPNMLKGLNQWSYGRINFNAYTISPLITLPHTTAEYRAGLHNAQNDAWEIAYQRYPVGNFSFTAICVNDLWPFGGSAVMVSTTLQINNPGESVFQHELGHCFGLPHANFWEPTTTDPIGPGNNREYGGSYDVMGYNWSSFNTMNRFYIRWLTMAETHNLASKTSGIYKIYDPDVVSLTPGRKHTIQIPRSDGNYYFVEFRPRPTDLTNKAAVDVTTRNGIRILRTNGAELLDVTPLSPNGQSDAALVVGKEFYDAGEVITIKALSKGGSGTDQYFDVEVLFETKTTEKNGHTYLLRSTDDNATFGITNSSSNNGAPVARMTSNGGLSQRWVLMKVDSSNYKIVNVNSGKVLEVGGFSQVNGGLVQQWDYIGIPNQKWRIVAVGGNNSKLINAGSGLALSVPFAIYSPSQQLQQYTYTGTRNQHWALDEVSPLVSGANYAIAARHSGQVVNLPSFNSAQGTKVQQFPYYGASNQLWTSSSQGGPLLAFTGLYSQKVLEVAGYAMGDSASIQQWGWEGHPWQKWSLVAVDHSANQIWYSMINSGSGKAIDVPNASNEAGLNLQQYSFHGGTNQQWNFSIVR